MRYVSFVALLIWLALGSTVHADDTKPLYAALGDSITAGYHRDGESENMYDFNFSFSGRISGTKDWDVENFGITNLTSDEFLDRLRNNSEWANAIRHAKCITLEIGANDFIRNPVFFPFIFEGKQLDPSDIDHLDEEKTRILTKYEENLRAVIELIQQESSAKLIVLNHYYLPLTGITGDFINSTIIESNKKLADLSKEKGFMVADLATAFSAAMTLSFLTQDMNTFPIDIKDMDPHPSAYGQKLIAYVLMDMMPESSKSELIPATLVSVLWMYFLSLFHN
jgi:lysophospholipase L1-like esterase